MSKRNIALAGAGTLLFAILLYQVPAINSRLTWRFEVARTYARNVLNPVGSVPTAIPNTPEPTTIASPSPTVAVTPTVQAAETAIPATNKATAAAACAHRATVGCPHQPWRRGAGSAGLVPES